MPPHSLKSNDYPFLCSYEWSGEGQGGQERRVSEALEGQVGGGEGRGGGEGGGGRAEDCTRGRERRRLRV